MMMCGSRPVSLTLKRRRHYASHYYLQCRTTNDDDDDNKLLCVKPDSAQLVGCFIDCTHAVGHKSPFIDLLLGRWWIVEFVSLPPPPPREIGPDEPHTKKISDCKDWRWHERMHARKLRNINSKLEFCDIINNKKYANCNIGQWWWPAGIYAATADWRLKRREYFIVRQSSEN